MEQPTTFGKLNGIPRGIEGGILNGKWPESQDAFNWNNYMYLTSPFCQISIHPE
jgi:hypothetical protein